MLKKISGISGAKQLTAKDQQKIKGGHLDGKCCYDTNANCCSANGFDGILCGDCQFCINTFGHCF